VAVKEGRKFKQCCEPDLGGNYLALIYDKDGWSAFYAQTGHGSGVFRNVQLENDGPPPLDGKISYDSLHQFTVQASFVEAKHHSLPGRSYGFLIIFFSQSSKMHGSSLQ